MAPHEDQAPKRRRDGISPVHVCRSNARTCSDDCSAQIIAAWKADFLEDADDLQLSTKRVFAPLIVAWAGDPEVKRFYLEHKLRDEASFAKLLTHLSAACKPP